MTTLDGAHQFHLDVLPPAQAIRLLGKLSGNARLDSEPGATEDLARQCDYLPLALRIAGARLAARLFRLLGLHRGTDVGGLDGGGTPGQLVGDRRRGPRATGGRTAAGDTDEAPLPHAQPPAAVRP